MAFLGSPIQQLASNKLSSPYYRFDGSSANNHIAVGDNNKIDLGLSDFSFECWYMPQESGRVQRLGKQYDATGWIIEQDANDRINFWHRSASPSVLSGDATSTGALTMDEWYHIVVTIDRDGLASFYFNGVLDSTDTISGSLGARTMTQTEDLWLFGEPDQNPVRGQGNMARLWNRLLTAAQVADLYGGASVHYRYKGASAVALNTGTAANTGFDNFSGASATGYTASDNDVSTASVAIRLTGTIEKGKTYIVDANHSTFTGVSNVYAQIREVTYGGNTYATAYGDFFTSGRKSIEFTAIADSIANPYLVIYYTTSATTSIVVSDIKLTRAGALAEYDGSGITSGFWYDKSGNNLVGRVSGATIHNKVTAFEAPLTISVGTADNSIASALNLVKAHTTAVGGNGAGAALDFWAENADGGTAYGAHQITARIAGYADSAVGGTGFEGGLKFYTVTDGYTPVSALEITHNKNATFAGTINANGGFSRRLDQSGGTSMELRNNSTATDHYAEMYIGDSVSQLVMGYSNNYASGQWQGGWVYAGAGNMMIKSGDANVEIFAGGTADSDRALILDTSLNATFAGEIAGNGTSLYGWQSQYKVLQVADGMSIASDTGVKGIWWNTYDTGTKKYAEGTGKYGARTYFSPTDGSLYHQATTATGNATATATLATVFTLTKDGAATFAGAVNINGGSHTAGKYGVVANTTGGDGSSGGHFTNSSSSGYQGRGVYAYSSGGFSLGMGIYCGSSGATTNYAMYAGGGDVYITNDIDIGGDILPLVDNSKDLGSSSLRWANLYVADAHYNNVGTGGNDVDGTEGSWTIQEGEDDLFLLNRKKGKKYKFKLEEV